MPSLLISGFEGFTDADFDIYAPKCWSNNQHNLPRMKTKERLLALARQVAALVQDPDSVVEATSELPSVWNNREVRDQWAFLVRQPEARRRLEPFFARDLGQRAQVQDPALHHRHLVLALRLSQEGLTIGLFINRHAAADLANAQVVSSEVLAERLAALPEAVLLGGERPTASRLQDALRATRGGAQDWVELSVVLPREAARGDSEQVGALFNALYPLYRLLAWREDNDLAGLSAELNELAAERATKAQADEEARRQATKEREAREAEARARTQEKVADQNAWQARQRQLRAKAQADAVAREAAQAAARAAEKAAAAPADEKIAAPVDEKTAEAQAEQAAALLPAPAPQLLEAEDRPARPQSDRPARPQSDRPVRPQGDRPQADRPARPQGDRPQVPARPQGDRPARPQGDRPARPQGDRPARPQGDRPTRPQSDRPARPQSEPRQPSSEVIEPAVVAAASPKRPLEIGDKCRLTRGLLAGKEGEVRGKDARDYLRVRVGNLEVAVSAADVVALS